MTYRRWVIFLAVCFAAFLVLELWAYFSGAPTLSQAVWAASDLWPIFGFVFGLCNGLLIGHFLWPRRKTAVRDTKPALFDAPYDEVFDHKSLKEHESRWIS